MGPVNWKRIATRDQIAAAAQAAGERIGAEYSNRNLVLVGVLEGAVFFLADLARAVPFPVRVATVRARSYGGGMASAGIVEVSGLRDVHVKGADVIVVDDIYDSGRTLTRVGEAMRSLGARSVEFACLLVKPAPRIEPVDMKYGLIEIPNRFVVGAGLDLAGRGRNLPDVWGIEPDVSEQAALEAFTAQFEGGGEMPGGDPERAR